jgi:hypothetical protein
MADTVKINRAPVMTLWAAVVAERMGYDRDAALTMGRVVSGLNAYSKGKRLGIIEEAEPGEKAEKKREAEARDHVELLGRRVPVAETPQGWRAISDGKPVSPDSVDRYLRGKFRDRLADVRGAMAELAESLSDDELDRGAYDLYEQFRPEIPAGTRGWGAYGNLDLDRLRAMARHRDR